MTRGPDAGTLLERALRGAALRAGVLAQVADATTTRWASATFTGARHTLHLAMDDGAKARAWLGTLADADLPMSGHLLADCDVVRTKATDGRLEAWIEALTVEER